MKKNLSVAVVMSVYNKKIYLEKSIQSILAQSFKKFDFIIINDCSSDTDIQTILLKFKKKDLRIKLLKNDKRLGLASSLNKVIKFYKYDLFFRMDGDDYAHKDRLKKQMNFMIKNPHVDISGCNAFLINNKNKIIGKTNLPLNDKDIKKKIMYSNPIIHPTVCFRKKIFLKKFFYNKNFKKCQDLELWMRLSSKKVVFQNLKSNLLYYRINKFVEFSTLTYDFRAALKHYFFSKFFFVPFVRLFKNILSMIIKLKNIF